MVALRLFLTFRPMLLAVKIALSNTFQTDRAKAVEKAVRVRVALDQTLSAAAWAN